jgi:hypothetical protein
MGWLRRDNVFVRTDDDLRKGSKPVVFFVLLIYDNLLDNTRLYIPLLCLTDPLCLVFDSLEIFFMFRNENEFAGKRR